MFTRERRIGRHSYTEALISYRAPDTGKPRHRCIARWRTGRSLADEIGRTQFDHEQAQHNVAVFQRRYDAMGRTDNRWPGMDEWYRKKQRAVQVRLTYWQRQLANATAHLEALNAVRQKLPADETEIEQAREAATQRLNAMLASFRPPDRRGTFTALAQRARGLAVENDPDAVRAGLVAIADALESLAA